MLTDDGVMIDELQWTKMLTGDRLRRSKVLADRIADLEMLKDTGEENVGGCGGLTVLLIIQTMFGIKKFLYICYLNRMNRKIFCRKYIED